MPQTSADWVFWTFSTILLGFLLNVAAGLLADPIARKLARRKRGETAAASNFGKRSTRSDPVDLTAVRLASLQPVVESDAHHHASVSSPEANTLSEEIDKFIDKLDNDMIHTIAVPRVILEELQIAKTQEGLWTGLEIVILEVRPPLPRSTRMSSGFQISLPLTHTVRAIKPSRTTWLIATLLLDFSLAISSLAVAINAPAAIPIIFLFVATILLVVAVTLLIKYIRRKAAVTLMIEHLRQRAETVRS